MTKEIDEGKVSAALLAKAKKKFREKGGINAALEKQDKETKEKEPVQHAKESLLDIVALADDEIPASHYIGEIESRINTAVNERKTEMKKSLFSFNEAEYCVNAYGHTRGGQRHEKQYTVKAVSRGHALDKAQKRIEKEHPGHKEYGAEIVEKGK